MDAPRPSGRPSSSGGATPLWGTSFGIRSEIVPVRSLDPEAPRRGDVDASSRRASSTSGLTHQIVGDYRILSRIQRGGMGELYLAERIEPDGRYRQVVLKRLLAGLVADDRYVSMFRAEAEVMSRLDHPNIVRVVDLPVMNDVQCLAMEYVHGRNLHQVLRRCRELGAAIPPPLALHVALEILEGLDYAHNFVLPDGRPLDLVHRDMTPGNVLCGFDGSVKITDFGISKSKMSVVATTVGVVKGTTRYLSPEQIRGASATAASDIFTTAVVFAEMLCGHPLFDRGSVPPTLFAIATGDRPDADELLPVRAPKLAQALEKALALAPERRFGSAREFRAAVREAGSELGPSSDRAAFASFLQELFRDTPEAFSFAGDAGEVGGLDALDLTYLLEVREPVDPMEETPQQVTATAELQRAKAALRGMVAGADPLDAAQFDRPGVYDPPSPVIDSRDALDARNSHGPQDETRRVRTGDIESVRAVRVALDVLDAGPLPPYARSVVNGREPLEQPRSRIRWPVLLGATLLFAVGSLFGVAITVLSSGPSDLVGSPGLPGSMGSSDLPRTSGLAGSPRPPGPLESSEPSQSPSPTPAPSQAEPAFIEVTGPRGARVFIDGRLERGRAPMLIGPLAPGPYRIRVEKGRYRRMAQVVLTDGERMELRVGRDER